MKFINGDGIILGRLSSYVAKAALKGESFSIMNCGCIIISGNKKTIEKEFKEKRNRFGDSHKGPKHSKLSEKIVKRAIRGMLPNFRVGRGREAFKRIKCYSGIPKEFEKVDFINLPKKKKIKFSKVEEFTK